MARVRAKRPIRLSLKLWRSVRLGKTSVRSRETLTGVLPMLMRGDDAQKIVLELARLPDLMRGFGHVKEANVAKAEALRAQLLEDLKSVGAVPAGGRRELAAA